MTTKYALEYSGLLMPFATRGQAAAQLDVILDKTPRVPDYEIYAMVPLIVWDDMQNWIEDLGLVVNDG